MKRRLVFPLYLLCAAALIFAILAVSCAKKSDVLPTEPATVTLTFDAVLPLYSPTSDAEEINGVWTEETLSPVTAISGEDLAETLPLPAERVGYRFSHWSLSKGGAPVAEVLEDALLYAVWEREEDFLPVTSEAEFLAMRTDGRYYLAEDITLSAPYGEFFRGIFDGNGRTVTLAVETQGDAALFLQNQGTLFFVKAEGSVKGGEAVGGIVAQNDGAVLCSSFSGRVDGESSAGGIAGYNLGFLSFCKTEGTVTGGNAAGGIVGNNSMGKLYACRADGTVVLSSSGKGSVGGIAGSLTFECNNIIYKFGSARYCLFLGELSAPDAGKNATACGLVGKLVGAPLLCGYAEFTARVASAVKVYGAAYATSVISVYGTHYPATLTGTFFSAESKAYYGAETEEKTPYGKEYVAAEGYDYAASLPPAVARFMAHSLGEEGGT